MSASNRRRIFVFAAWLMLAGAGSAPAATPSGPAAADLYQAGMDDYARGDLDAALASFRAALVQEPENRPATAAAHRMEFEIAARDAAHDADDRAARLSPPSAFDRFCLVTVPRWFYFERTIGDGLANVGTMHALNARVAQLLAERKIAFARKRPFKKELQLRALVRRMPAATRESQEV
jgi:hypothetical protein